MTTKKTPIGLSVFQQMIAFSEEYQQPLTFKNDLLVHDRAYLEAHPGSVFVWVLYNSGTHVIRLSHRLGASPYVPVADLVRQVHNAFEEDGERLFICNDQHDTVVSCRDLEDCVRLVREYGEKVNK